MRVRLPCERRKRRLVRSDRRTARRNTSQPTCRGGVLPPGEWAFVLALTSRIRPLPDQKNLGYRILALDRAIPAAANEAVTRIRMNQLAQGRDMRPAVAGPAQEGQSLGRRRSGRTGPAGRPQSEADRRSGKGAILEGRPTSKGRSKRIRSLFEKRFHLENNTDKQQQMTSKPKEGKLTKSVSDSPA